MIDADTNASGWFSDPGSIHHLRYWSGVAWTARVADKYGATSAHHLEGDFAPPRGNAATPIAGPAPAPPVASTPAPTAQRQEPARLHGWQADPFGRFGERYYVAGQPSQVVRTNGVEAIDPTLTTRAGSRAQRRAKRPDTEMLRNLKVMGTIAGVLVIVVLIVAGKP